MEMSSNDMSISVKARTKIEVSLKLVPGSPIDNKFSLVQVMSTPKSWQAITCTRVKTLYRSLTNYASPGLNKLRIRYYLGSVLIEQYHVKIRPWSLTHCKGDLKKMKFWCLQIFSWYWLEVDATWLYQLQVNIGSSNGLVPDGIKPLHEPLLTKIYVAIWCHMS